MQVRGAHFLLNKGYMYGFIICELLFLSAGAFCLINDNLDYNFLFATLPTDLQGETPVILKQKSSCYHHKFCLLV